MVGGGEAQTGPQRRAWNCTSGILAPLTLTRRPAQIEWPPSVQVTSRWWRAWAGPSGKMLPWALRASCPFSDLLLVPRCGGLAALWLSRLTAALVQSQAVGPDFYFIFIFKKWK